MPVFPLLRAPGDHCACDWDFIGDDEGRAYYLTLFGERLGTVVRAAAISSGYDEERIDRALGVFSASLDRLRQDPRALGDRLDILSLDIEHSRCLREAGVDDPFRAIKERETKFALGQLGERLAQIDAVPDSERIAALMRGVFAGNLFDMGSIATARMFEGPPTAPPAPFEMFLGKVKDRPWLFDDADGIRVADRGKVMVFVDNAGADVVLGVLPMVREMLRGGARVVLAANDGAAWNDMTARELREALGVASEVDEIFADERLTIVGTGTSQALIDLTGVSDALCGACEGVDLVVLVGMGRAIESNWDARFSVESWRLATLKDPRIAERKGGVMYDCVCRVDEGWGG